MNVAVHVFGFSHKLVAVNTTVTEPPHAAGAPVLLLLIVVPQPPVEETVASQVLNLVFMTA